MSTFKIGDSVKKKSGSSWEGRVVGTYSTELTPEGYAVESFVHKGSVQIYPANALEILPQQPSVRDDGMPASKDERHLRRLLAGRVNMLHTYYDDGEVQGEEHGISIDFMREPAAGIAAKLRELGVARYKCEQPSVREPLTDKQIGMAVYNCDYFSSDTLKIARAIERAHGIGVKGEA